MFFKTGQITLMETVLNNQDTSVTWHQRDWQWNYTADTWL